jgi:hypothetical protein
VLHHTDAVAVLSVCVMRRDVVKVHRQVGTGAMVMRRRQMGTVRALGRHRDDGKTGCY